LSWWFNKLLPASQFVYLDLVIIILAVLHSKIITIFKEEESMAVAFLDVKVAHNNVLSDLINQLIELISRNIYIEFISRI